MFKLVAMIIQVIEFRPRKHIKPFYQVNQPTV